MILIIRHRGFSGAKQSLLKLMRKLQHPHPRSSQVEERGVETADRKQSRRSTNSLTSNKCDISAAPSSSDSTGLEM